jgi:glycosyltransferase involved in cell wall biosynthesis
MNLITKKIEKTIHGNHVCLVTEELAGIGSSGGIGAAFLELAKLLSKNAFVVDVLYCPCSNTTDKSGEMASRRDFASVGIKLHFLDPSKCVTEPFTYEKKSYAVSRWLFEADVIYDYIHFHDYKGLGFFSTSLKRQNLGLQSSQIVVQLHGPTRWTIEANHVFFSHEEQLKIDHMERMSIAQADTVVSPSAYLVEWMKNNSFRLPEDVRVIKNVCSELSQNLSKFIKKTSEVMPCTDIVCFARHEDRKGFSIFCDALDIAADEISRAGVTVTFLGQFGLVKSQPSGIYLSERSEKWNFNLKIRSGYSRNDAVQYIVSKKNPLVVIPSNSENSPYTVLESIMLRVPVLSSVQGGGSELFDTPHYEGLCSVTPEELAKKLCDSVVKGIPQPVPAMSIQQIENVWIDFHKTKKSSIHLKDLATTQPLVTFAITHYERPSKLTDAVLSVISQTYKNIEIIVVDDGSKNKETQVFLKNIEVILNRVGGRLIYRQNGYLGAARNTALAAAKGDYICFLDDDDIAKPELVETLVTAAINIDADVVNCMNIYMDETLRGEVLTKSKSAPSLVSYVPLGGPLSVSPIDNCLGAATALFRRSALESIGGYTELKGVGHEDYELFVRLLQANYKLTIAPRALYYYEVGRPSMLSNTSLVANFRRCFDALNFDRNSTEWKDFVNLQMGKHVAIQAHNRQHWLYSIGKNGQIKNEILTNHLSREALLEKLMELALVQNKRDFYNVLKEDVESESYLVNQSEVEVVNLKRSKTFDMLNSADSTASVTEGTLSARFDLALGRYDDCIDKLVSILGGDAVITDHEVLLIKEVVNTIEKSGIDMTRLIALRDAILCAKCTPILRENMLGIAIIISLAVRDVSVVDVLVDDIRIQNNLYLKSRPDVASSIKYGGFSSGLDHYIKYGKNEGVDAFAILNVVFKVIESNSSYSDDARKLLDRICSELLRRQDSSLFLMESAKAANIPTEVPVSDAVGPANNV